LNVDWIKQFGSEAPSSFKPTMNTLPKDLATADDNHFHAVGTGLGNALMNEGKGGVLYSHLKQFVPKETLDNYLRQPMLAGDSATVMKRLNAPVAQDVFGSDLDKVKRLAASQDTKTLMGKAAPVAKWGLEAAAPFVGHALLPGGGGALAGAAVSGIGELASRKFFPHGVGNRAPLFERYAGKPAPAAALPDKGLRAALPLVRPSSYTQFLKPSTYKGGRLPAAAIAGHRPPVGGAPIAPIAPVAAAPAPVTADAEARVDPLAGMSYGYDPTGKNRYASGGAVKGHQHLVDRLFSAAERAKREEKAHTADILHQPDEAVAKALHVAQAAI
jgi:hypothetical protein